MDDWQEIHIKAHSQHKNKRIEAVIYLRDNFQEIAVKDEQQAFKDLLSLTKDLDNHVRKHAVSALDFAFRHVAYKEEAGRELLRLTKDEHADVRKRAVSALGSVFHRVTDKEEAWKELLMLTKDEHVDVRRRATGALCSAFHCVADKEEACNELLKLTTDKDVNVRKRVADVLGSSFSNVVDKEKACNELLKLTKDKDVNVRFSAVYALGSAFHHVADKEEAWNELLVLTKDEHADVRRCAADALGSAFQHVANKEEAWNELLVLTKDENINVRLSVADALCSTFSHVTDKKKAWKELLALTQYKHTLVRRCVADALGSVSHHVADKDRASEALLLLTKNGHYNVRKCAIAALGSAFPHVMDKDRASKALLALTKDENIDVRKCATNALDSAFPHVMDKDKASKALITLTKDENIDVRKRATAAIGSVFPLIMDKDKTLKALITLTKDEDNYVRVYANHSLGKISIFKATEAEGEEGFRTELEHALEYFENSAKESSLWNNPAKFCLPFYRSFHTITFRKEESEAEVKRSIEKAKLAVGKSESKEKLLEAIENLSNALTETQNAKDFAEIQGDFNAYSRYCRRASDLLLDTEESAPSATMLIKRGVPIIDKHIKDILGDIQEKSRELCKDTLDTPFEKEGKEVNKAGQELFNVRDPIGLEKSVDNLHMALSAVCDRMPEEHKGEACKILTKAQNEEFVEDKLDLISMVLSKIPLIIPKETKKEPDKNFQNLKIFVSSTVKDLEYLRDELYRHLKETGHTPWFSEMHDFPVNRHPDAMTNCLKVTEECDLFIVILDKRAGLPYTERENTPYLDLFGLTISEAEYRCARNNVKPICIFIRNRTENESVIYWKNKKIIKDFEWYSDSEVYEFYERLMNEKPHVPWRYTFDSIEDIKKPLNEVIKGL